MHKSLIRLSYALNYVFQVTFCMLTPAAMWIGFGWLLHYRWSVGKWAFILCVVLGVFSGAVSMFRFLLSSSYAIDPTASAGKEDGKHEQ